MQMKIHLQINRTALQQLPFAISHQSPFSSRAANLVHAIITKSVKKPDVLWLLQLIRNLRKNLKSPLVLTGITCSSVLSKDKITTSHQFYVIFFFQDGADFQPIRLRKYLNFLNNSMLFVTQSRNIWISPIIFISNKVIDWRIQFQFKIPVSFYWLVCL